MLVSNTTIVSDSFVLSTQHSWAQFMYVRCQNCNRKPANATSEPKPKKKKTSDNHHYSTIVSEPEDAETHARNMELLETEWTKFKDKKASADGVKELMSRTFLHRREWIRHSERPVSEIMKEYRCLSRLIFVRSLFCIPLVYYILLDRLHTRWT